MRRRLWLLTIPVLFCALGIVLERALISGAPTAARRTLVHPGEVLELRAHAGLLEAGLLVPCPRPDGLARIERNQPGGDPREAGILVYSPPTLLPPSSRVPSTELMDGVLLNPQRDHVSLAVDPVDLWHPETGILANPEQRGRDWERTAYLSFYEGAELRFESAVGIRVHGGSNRGSRIDSLRIYLRPEYGSNLDGSASLLGGGALPRFVLRAEERSALFANQLAYDVAREIGGVVPQTRPVRTMLNGEVHSRLMFLTERLDETLLQRRFGHSDFLVVREKPFGKQRKPDEYLAAVHELRNRASSLNASKAALRLFDVENVARWCLSILVCGTDDACQGMAYLDRRVPRPLWRWAHWDMDWSFREEHNLASLRGRRNDVRAIAFERFMQEDPAFRGIFLDRVCAAFNHDLKEQLLRDFVHRHQQVARDYLDDGAPSRIEQLEQYLQFLMDQRSRLPLDLQAEYGAGPLHRCQVITTPGVPLRVDGREVGPDYRGEYFQGRSVWVRYTGSPELWSHWKVNGVVVEQGPLLRWPMNEEITVEAVLKDARQGP